jgi:GTP-binding protein HflX
VFDRPSSGERALLVHIDIGTPVGADADTVEELELLAASAGATVVGLVTGSRAAPDRKLFVGTGKAEEIKAMAASGAADLVIFNHSLSPSQERNLERLLECRVVDRNGLILDIFAQRARSFAGKLQVELAQLRHLSTRLVRGWTHLERQKGGIGLRGPGETQLETDRRLLGKRIAILRERIERIDAQRLQGRRARQKAELPTVSLVGYTNAGKSTLFNALTQAGVYQADQLFATLDPTLRRVELPGSAAVVLADTVGFINHLPHELVAAFRSTLEETRTADLLLHVIDAASEVRDRRIQDVEGVLEEIDAGEVPRLEVFNKLDLLPGRAPALERDAEGRPRRVWVSARDGSGLEQLLGAIAELTRGDEAHRRLRLGPADGRLRAWAFSHGRVLKDRAREGGGWDLDLSVSRPELDRLLHREPGLADRFLPLPESQRGADEGLDADSGTEPDGCAGSSMPLVPSPPA